MTWDGWAARLVRQFWNMLWLNGIGLTHASGYSAMPTVRTGTMPAGVLVVRVS